MYKSYSDKSYVLSSLQAFLIATISACAVGSLLFNTSFEPIEIILLFLSTIAAPNGPPFFSSIPLLADLIASFIILFIFAFSSHLFDILSYYKTFFHIFI